MSAVSHEAKTNALRRDWIPISERRGMPLLQRASGKRNSKMACFSFMLTVALWVRDTRRTWFTSRDVADEFNLGYKQVYRYMRAIGAAVPLERQLSEGRIYWRVIR